MGPAATAPGALRPCWTAVLIEDVCQQRASVDFVKAVGTSSLALSPLVLLEVDVHIKTQHQLA